MKNHLRKNSNKSITINFDHAYLFGSEKSAKSNVEYDICESVCVYVCFTILHEFL